MNNKKLPELTGKYLMLTYYAYYIYVVTLPWPYLVRAIWSSRLGRANYLALYKLFVQDSYNKPRTRVCGKTIGNWKTDLLCGTWNVRTLHKPGAALDFVKELEKYRIKCVALQEIRWEDAGITKIS